MRLSLRTPAGPHFSFWSGSVLVALVFLALPVPALWASAAQTEIQEKLPARETILGAPPAMLADAVAAAIYSNTNISITPADMAAAALEPVDGAVRADRNTVAGLVARAAIDTIISDTDANLSADAAAITDSLVDVNANVGKEGLSTGGRVSVVKAALAAISDAAVSGEISGAALEAADQAIGQDLAGDTYLETSLPAGALMTILQKGITGITGATGKSQPVAPEAAEYFVQGLISSRVPEGASYPAFATAILEKVSTNTSVDELVAYQVGLKDNLDQFNLLTLASTLFSRYPSAITKITQGITAVTPQGSDDEQARAAFVQALAALRLNDAVSIAQGAAFVDPFFAGEFTQAVCNSILGASNGEKLMFADAPRVAAGVGAILGQDGNVLTHVADVFSQLIAAHHLPVARAAACAAGLIRGAAGSNVPASQFTGAAAGAGGGRLDIGAGITAATVTDLASVVDLLADGIVAADHSALTGTGLKSACSGVRALVEAVARLTGNELFVDSSGVSQPVAAFLAGTLADTIVQSSLGSTAQAAFLIAITKGVTAVTNDTVDGEVKTSVASYGEYPVVGEITTQETAVTNL